MANGAQYHEREHAVDPATSAALRRNRTQFEAFASPYNFASNLWCDMVIDPLETRDTLALLFELAGRQPPRETRFGVFRM